MKPQAPRAQSGIMRPASAIGRFLGACGSAALAVGLRGILRLCRFCSPFRRRAAHHRVRHFGAGRRPLDPAATARLLCARLEAGLPLRAAVRTTVQALLDEHGRPLGAAFAEHQVEHATLMPLYTAPRGAGDALITVQAFRDVARGGFAVFVDGRPLAGTGGAAARASAEHPAGRAFELESVSEGLELAEAQWGHRGFGAEDGEPVVQLFRSLVDAMALPLRGPCDGAADGGCAPTDGGCEPTDGGCEPTDGGRGPGDAAARWLAWAGERRDVLDAVCVLASLVSQSTFNLLFMHVQQCARDALPDPPPGGAGDGPSASDVWCREAKTADGDTHRAVRIARECGGAGGGGGGACAGAGDGGDGARYVDGGGAGDRLTWFAVEVSMPFEALLISPQTPEVVASFTATHRFAVEAAADAAGPEGHAQWPAVRGRWCDRGVRELVVTGFAAQRS